MIFLMNGLAALFGGLFAWLSQTLIKRIAIIAAFTAIVGTLVATLIGVLEAQVAAMAAANEMPDWIVAGLAWLPSNTGTLLGLIVTVEAALWIYRMSYKLAAIRVGAV